MFICAVSIVNCELNIFVILSHLFSAQIENKLLSDFSLRLFEFFCGNEKRQEIQVRNVHDLEGTLSQMFLENQRDVSISSTSKVLPEVKTIAFTDFLEEDLMENGMDYIESVREYAHSGSSKIQRVEFRSVFQEKTRPNSEIRDLVEDQNAAFSEFGWSLEYQCYDGHYHRINAKMLFEKPKNLRVNTVWTPKSVNMDNVVDEASHSVPMTLSLDIDSEIINDFSEKKKEKFTNHAVKSFLMQKGVDLQSDDSEVVIDDVGAGSLHINYHLVSNAVDIFESVEQLIAESDTSVEVVEFDSMMMPVTGNKEREFLPLAERTMRGEVVHFEKAQAERRRLDRVLAVERGTWPRWTGKLGRRLVKKVQSLLNGGDPVWDERKLIIIQEFCTQKQSKYAVFLLNYYLLLNFLIMQHCHCCFCVVLESKSILMSTNLQSPL